MVKVNLILIYFFLLFSSLLKSQTDNLGFEQISVEQGLSQSTIYSIHQDNRGFLWFGTADGLNRYDGYKFVVYRHEPDDSLSLSNNRIYSIQEDKEGNLWLGTNGGGLNKFNRENETFIHRKYNPNINTSLSSNKILKIYFDSSGILWVGTEGGGLNKFDQRKEIFIRYKNNPEDQTSISNNVIRSIYEDKSGSLWIGTADGLNKFDRTAEKFLIFKNDKNNHSSISDNEILSIFEDSYGQFWVGTGSGGINKFDKVKNTFTRFKFNAGNPKGINSNRIFSITEDNSGVLWIGTMSGGLNKFNREDNTFNHYTQNSEDPLSVNDNFIFSVYSDRSGVLWIGTYKGGINKLDNSKQRFRHLTHNPESLNNLSDYSVYSFCENEQGEIWIGTSNGLNKFNKTKNSFTHYFHDPFNDNSISSDEVLAVYIDKSSGLWIGTYGGGLNFLDVRNNKFTHYNNNPQIPSSISSNKIFSICEDEESYLWIGTDGEGLNKFDRNKNQFSHYFYNGSDNTSIGANKIYTIYEDKSGVLWFGTDGGGLNKYDKEKNHFVHYMHDPKDPQSISNNSIFSIYEDKSGNLWLGTYGGGLNKFDRHNKTFKYYRESDGLPNEVIYGILEDGKSNLWLSTNKGLTVFNPQTEQFISYDIRDGIQSNEFNQGAYLKTKDGSMLFGGINGFNFFHPDSLKKNTNIPKVVITDFQVFNKSVTIESRNGTILSSSITEASEINLTYEDNVISFEFSALDFQTPSKNRYAYYMKGFDKDWNYTDAKRRFVTYTNLDPGDYVFRVKASNNDGIWNEEGVSINVYISPPWWATWWAYGFYGVFFLVSLFAIRAYDMKRQRLKHELKLEHEHSRKLQEIDQIKSRFFANISHEFRTPLTLIIGPAEKIISGIPYSEIQKHALLVKKNAISLLGLIGQLLDLSRLDEGKLKLRVSCANLVSFVKGIIMSFESIAESRDITLRVKTEKEKIEVYFDKEKMERIMINILSNAFKFTEEGDNITVTLTEKNNSAVLIKIRDTGIGIAEKELPKLFDRFYQVDSSHTRERGGTGIGLSLTKELVELHHGSITVNSVEGEWTELTIDLPLGKKHFSDSEIFVDDSQYEIQINEAENIIRDGKNSFEKTNYPGIPDIPYSDSIEEKTIILVVEDNPDVRTFIKDSLESEYRIEEAANGEQGIRKAKNIIPDLIVCDIMMPKLDGIELTKILKNDEKTCHIPIILLTAKSEQASKLVGLETGADDYLTKPFDTKELQIRIRNLIEIRRKLQEKYSSADFVPEKKEPDKKYNSLDEKFMNKILEVIEVHLSEEEFSIEQFSREAGMSRTQLHRKLKALSGKSASIFIRSVRLNKAKKMIEEQKGNISEIAYSVGFSSPAYFTKCFKEEYGFNPSDLTN